MCIHLVPGVPTYSLLVNIGSINKNLITLFTVDFKKLHTSLTPIQLFKGSILIVLAISMKVFLTVY